MAIQSNMQAGMNYSSPAVWDYPSTNHLSYKTTNKTTREYPKWQFFIAMNLFYKTTRHARAI